jgi:hypothetical protein
VEFWVQVLVQNGDGDAFVAAVEVAVGAKFGAPFDGIAGILLEDTPFFTKNDARDDPFPLAAKQGGAQGSAKCPSFPSRAVAMNDFDGDDARLLGLTEFSKKPLARFVDGGETSFNVKNSECGHGRTRVNCA